MNRPYSLLLLSLALSSTIGGSRMKPSTGNGRKIQRCSSRESKDKAMSAEEMAAHSDEAMHHAMPMPTETAVAQNIDTDEIGRNADDLPPPVNRTEAQVVRVDLYTDELVAEMMPEVTYHTGHITAKCRGRLFVPEQGIR